MQKLIVSLLLSSAAFQFSFGQTGLIKGNIADTHEKKELSNAVVLLLGKADSIMVKYVRTDKAGIFILKNLPAGRFLLIISYPSYADYTDEIDLKDSAQVDLHSIRMIQKSQLLQEVVVNGDRAAIHIKGDTLEFRADSFFVRKDATVEDLLKKLPGIQIDKNGKITAQGESVQKVLVDGEEFFGDDPTLVTQNLRADMVDKVQVYDKKSDQAVFTGIDDGQKTKTINLKLKDDKKNGYFGKINVGIGTNGYYDNQAMVNKFKKKEKIGLYGIISNTGKTGLNWQENNNYGESFANSVDYDETMGYFSWSGQSDELDNWNGQYNGQGFPSVQTGGIHYNNKWNDDKESINGNYKILQLHVTGNSVTNSQYILPDTSYYNNQKQSFDNRILRNRGSASYEMKFDSTSSVKITADGGTDHKMTHGLYYSEALATDSSLVNQGNRTISDISDTRTVNSNILWRKRLHKKGRTFSVNIRENYSGSSSGGNLFANNNFFGKAGLTQNQVTDQYKNYQSENILLDTKITYTEPLSSVSALVADYGVSINNSNSNRNSYNKAASGKYTSLDSLYSNDYQFNVFTQRGGLAYNLTKKKLRLNAGNNIGFTQFSQQDLHQKILSKRNFINWYPRASLTYSFSQQKRLRLSYNGNTTQPTIQQIQPILTNEDPLNISIGNPNLKPQFSNNIDLNFNDYKIFTERNIYANVSYNFTQNAISSKDHVDSSGKRIYQSVNLNGDASLNGYFGYGFKIKKPELHLNFNLNFNQTRYVSIVNDLSNITNSLNYTAGVNLYKSKEKKYTIGFYSSATYTNSLSSINTGITTRYWSFNSRPELDLFLPLKFSFHSDCDFNFRQKTNVFDVNTNVILWNAWIGKKLIKNDALMLKVSVNDLLNQNIGFNRAVNSNYISQNTYNTIQRFFMLSVVWNFNKAGTPAPAEQ